MIQFLGLDEPRHAITVVGASVIVVGILLAPRSSEFVALSTLGDLHDLVRRIKIEIHEILGDVELCRDEGELQIRWTRLER